MLGFIKAPTTHLKQGITAHKFIVNEKDNRINQLQSKLIINTENVALQTVASTNEATTLEV